MAAMLQKDTLLPSERFGLPSENFMTESEKSATISEDFVMRSEDSVTASRCRWNGGNTVLTKNGLARLLNRKTAGMQNGQMIFY